MDYNIYLNRIYRGQTYTIGKLCKDNPLAYKTGGWLCDTLEDTDRDKNRNGYFDNGETKIYGQTCIPNGRFRITLCYSPKFTPRYGMNMPLINGIPSFSECLIHPGNTIDDTCGCILVGENKVKGKVLNSRETFMRLMEELFNPILMNPCNKLWLNIS